MFRRVLGALGAVVVGALVSTVATPASACSVDPCASTVRLTPTRYLPGNLVYFQIVGDDPAEIALRTAEGEPVAASIRTIGNDRVFAPEQPIAENTQLVLEYSIQCFGELFPQPLQQTFEFMTTAPGEIELIPARLEIEEVGVKQPGRDETSFARVRHWPGDGNGVASSLMTHTYAVDGVPVWPQAVGGMDLIEVPVACHPQVSDAQVDSCGRLYTAPAGPHTVEVSTHIVGATTQPEPVRLEVDVQCPDPDAADPSGGPEPQPSMPDMQMAESSESTSDTAPTLDGDSAIYTAGDDAALPEPAAPPLAASNGGGCALGSSGARAEGIGLLALAAAFMLGRARRRAPRSQ